MFFPDLASDNVLYDPTTGKSYIIDYDGAQIKNIKECSNTSLYKGVKVLCSRKYLPNGLYNHNIDKFTLVVRYFYYTTKINLGKIPLSRSELKEFVKIVGLQGTEYADLLIRAFDYDLSNGYIGNAIQDLKKNYTLSPHIEKQPRIFIKK